MRRAQNSTSDYKGHMTSTPSTSGPDPLAVLAGLLSSVELSSTVSNRFAHIESWLANELELDPDEVVRVTFVSAPKMVAPRLSTPGIIKASPALVVAVLGRDIDARVVDAIRRKVASEDHLRNVLLVQEPEAGGTWEYPTVFTRPGETLSDRVRKVFPGVAQETVGPAVTVPALASGGPRPSFGSARAMPKVIVHDRIRRLLQHHVATSPATVLIGPPGTGKTTLVEEVLHDLAHDPASFGLASAPQWGSPVTPDESWTASEILGGPTIVDGDIVFRSGHVLQAIRDRDCLIIDEVNRADLDKILGGLLTWLSGKEVVVGRLTEDAGAPAITVGWNDGTESIVVNENLLDDPSAKPDDDDGPVRFLAGTEWRLLATYNATDAQRVFRFGEALGRRFSKVPIPPPTVEAASELIAERCLEHALGDEASLRVTNLYEAHLTAEETVLGAAPFLDLLRYVALLSRTGKLDLSDDDQVEDAVAEAYLAQVGLNLARLEEDELDRLGDRHADAGALQTRSWQWIREMLPAFR